MPFGEELPVQAQNSSNTRQFTGHERDGESGLDYMLARYSSSSINRFLSPDPQTFHTINPEERELFLENPQKWNQYSYVLNNPIRLTDPDGRAPSAAVKPLKARSWWEIIFDWVFRRGNPIDARSKVLDVTKAGIFFELQSVRAKAQGLYPPSTPISVEGEVELIDIIQSLNQLQAELGSADNEAELAKVKAELDALKERLEKVKGQEGIGGNPGVSGPIAPTGPKPRGGQKTERDTKYLDEQRDLQREGVIKECRGGDC